MVYIGLIIASVAYGFLSDIPHAFLAFGLGIIAIEVTAFLARKIF